MEELQIAVMYSYGAMTWITWLALGILIAKTIMSFNAAYKDNATYEDMRKNPDKKGISQFYTGIIVSILSIIVFFLPYFLNYQG